MSRSLQVLGWLGATALLVFLASRVDRSQVGAVMSAVSWGWLVIAVVANALILVAWSGLWWTVSPKAERPTYATMFEINAIASALMNTVPFLGGHAAAVALLIKRAGMTRTAALSVMALDQLGEGMAKVTIFLLAAIAAPLPDVIRISAIVVCSGVAGLLLAMVAFSHAHAVLQPRVIKLTFTSRMRVLAATWAQRMETLRDTTQSLLALALAIGTKVAEAAGLMAVQAAFGIDLSIGGTMLVLSAISLSSMLPVAPGNVGTYEAAAIIAYQHLGLDSSTATMLAITSHLCFMLPSIGVGYVVGSWRTRSALQA